MGGARSGRRDAQDVIETLRRHELEQPRDNKSDEARSRMEVRPVGADRCNSQLRKVISLPLRPLWRDEERP